MLTSTVTTRTLDIDPRGRAGLRRRIFAWIVCKGTPRLDRTLAPYKRRLLGPLRGDVVEIGAGAGASLPFLDSAVRLIAIEPSPPMRRYLAKAIEQSGLDVQVLPALGADTGLPDRCADAAICLHVLCSVPDVPATLREIRRILRAGGRLVFIEHVAAPRGGLLRVIQSLVRGPSRWCGDGCDPTRDTLAEIRAAGFDRIEFAQFRVPLAWASPHIAGCAVAPS